MLFPVMASSTSSQTHSNRDFFLSLGRGMIAMAHIKYQTTFNLAMVGRLEEFMEDDTEADEEAAHGPGHTFVGSQTSTSEISGKPFQQIRLIGVGKYWRKNFVNLYVHRQEGELAIKCGQYKKTWLRAHKEVFEARSEFFGYLLECAPEDSAKPLLVYKEIPASLMRSIVEFVYLGETVIYRKSLDQFVEVSNFLGFQGIKPREIFASVNNSPASA